MGVSGISAVFGGKGFKGDRISDKRGRHSGLPNTGRAKLASAASPLGAVRWAPKTPPTLRNYSVIRHARDQVLLREGSVRGEQAVAGRRAQGIDDDLPIVGHREALLARDVAGDDPVGVDLLQERLDVA